MSKSILISFVLVFAIYFTAETSAGRLPHPKSLQNQGRLAAGDLIRVAGFIAFREKNGVTEYILLLKKQAPEEKDDWSPPKGKLDPLEGCAADGEFEDPLEAAKRETFEETGLLPDDYSIYLEFPYLVEYNMSDGTPKEVYFWPAKLKNGDQQIILDPHEHTEYRWLNFADSYAIIKKQFRQALIDTNEFIVSQIHGSK